ncbi:MAG: hypothetical protein AAGD10_11410 [Myxococcota bacterium]
MVQNAHQAMDAFLAKPVTRVELRTALNRLQASGSSDLRPSRA